MCGRLHIHSTACLLLLIPSFMAVILNLGNIAPSGRSGRAGARKNGEGDKGGDGAVTENIDGSICV